MMKKVNKICKSRHVWVFIFGLASIIGAILIIKFLWSDRSYEELLKTNGIWTAFIAVFSAPVLFLIWIFRDQNATQQIENQRKDINLKEFQKIAEWVSGLHLIEPEMTEKETPKKNEASQEEETNEAEKENSKEWEKTEKTKKYTLPDESRSILTFSKSDGAVGLQIAAIYNLLPFFRGEHGETFRRPALNLLTSAWLSLQQNELLALDKVILIKQGDIQDEEKFENAIETIQKRASSPIGVALTQVLLSDGGDNLLKFPEVFPNLCLAGMNFHLPGLDKRVLNLFERAKECEGINLIGANLNQTNLSGANLSKADLSKATLSGATLIGANLSEVDLRVANLSEANLIRANLSRAILFGANLIRANLSEANLSEANLSVANLSVANLIRANLSRAILFGATLRDANLSEANLIGANLRRANLIRANLIRADLSGAKLNEANLSKAIINDEAANLYGTLELKKQGAIILYHQDDSNARIKLIFTNENGNGFTHILYNKIDLAKTQQENPDWKISIEELKD